MMPRKLTSLGGFYLAPGYSTEFLHMFLAQDLYPSRLDRDADENIQAELVPLAAVLTMMSAGELQDAKSIAGLTLALGALEKGHEQPG
jgi:ADP-ribose pyrophosphatase